MTNKPIVNKASLHLHIYHRLPRLRLAVAKRDLNELWKLAEEKGLKVKKITLEGGDEVYPRFRRLEDGRGRLVIPSWFVEKLGLKPCNTYAFYIHLAYPIMKVKIRIYNEELTSTPRGSFQGFYLITVPTDASTLTPIWGHPLTEELVARAKMHFVYYWRGQPIPYHKTLFVWMKGRDAYRGVEKVPANEGVAEPRAKVEYLRNPEEEDSKVVGLKPLEYTYAKGIPPDFVDKAEKLTIEELVVGESAVVPEPAKKSDLGVWWQDSMVIKRVFDKRTGMTVPKVVWHDKRGAPRRVYPSDALFLKFVSRVEAMPDVYVED